MHHNSLVVLQLLSDPGAEVPHHGPPRHRGSAETGGRVGLQGDGDYTVIMLDWLKLNLARLEMFDNIVLD